MKSNREIPSPGYNVTSIQGIGNWLVYAGFNSTSSLTLFHLMFLFLHFLFLFYITFSFFQYFLRKSLRKINSVFRFRAQPIFFPLSELEVLSVVRLGIFDHT